MIEKVIQVKTMLLRIRSLFFAALILRMKRHRTHATKHQPFKKPRQLPKKVAPTKSLVYQQNTVPSRGSEKKEIVAALPTAAGVVNSTTFSAGTLLNHTAQGTGATNRLGRKIALHSILVRYSLSLAPTSVGGSPCRILIVFDKQSNGVAPAITDILLSNDFHSPMNLNNTDRFIIIFDEMTEPVAVSGNYSVSKNLYRKLGLEVQYKDTSNNDITDFASGSIYAFVAQNSAVTTAAGAIASLTRIRFSDP